MSEKGGNESTGETVERSEVVAGKASVRREAEGSSQEAEPSQRDEATEEPNEKSGIAVYHKCYAPVVQRILKPFFFVSNPHPR